ncbi:SDR family NAD(P)-dependent oxidoreductase [Bradyrhizobium sp. 2TAF24]|uniref:SDR family NAD(P)-dependent oxidoreductase n=1 Tax=Bradyrhizobium sp. 2TAF24 TaxID=3233011 RepID=UPI003F929298
MSGQRLAGRKALVTGGARGIGADLAAALAKAGAAVMIGDVLAEEGRATAATIAQNGGTCGFVALDVTSDAQWDKAVATTVAELGGYDILVNNAGIEIAAPLIDVSAEDLKRMFDINVVGVALGMKHAFRAMRPGGAAGRGGAVVNISSVAATIAFPAIAGYSASKSAVDRMTRIGAVEAGKLGYGVRVNCVYPGLIANAMGINLANEIVKFGLAPDVEAAVAMVLAQTPLGRLCEQRNVADAVVFLCSDEASCITGAGLPVDGGMGT